MQKALKLIAISLSLTIICVMFTSCISVNNTDYPKKYVKFLKYSLGDYKVETSKLRNHSNEISRYWTIGYHDMNEKEQTLYLNNDLYKDNDDNYFGSQIMNNAAEICINELEKNVSNKYFTAKNENNPFVYFNFEDPAIKDNDDDYNDNDNLYVKYMNENSGIKLKDITAKSFMKTWNLILEIEIQVKLSDNTKIDTIIDQSKLMLKDLSTYLDISDINCDIKTDDDSYNYKVEYNKNENKYSVTPKEKEHHDEYPKGHAV